MDEWMDGDLDSSKLQIKNDMACEERLLGRSSESTETWFAVLSWCDGGIIRDSGFRASCCRVRRGSGGVGVLDWRMTKPAGEPRRSSRVGGRRGAFSPFDHSRSRDASEPETDWSIDIAHCRAPVWLDWIGLGLNCSRVDLDKHPL